MPFPSITPLLLALLLLEPILGSPAILAGARRRRWPGFSASESNCEIFRGVWTRDESYPIYESSECPVIDPEFNCQLYGRPDSDYLKYRWRPTGCEIPRFNGVDFLTRMREKTVMFVGDSLGRNQWQSLICMIHSSVPTSEARYVRGDPLSTYKFLEYGVTVSFYRAPYLVDMEMVGGKVVLRLDDISRNGEAWKGADILSFNSGHWWTHRGALQGWDYLSDGGAYYIDMDRQVAFQKGMSTWADWVDRNIDRTTTTVFLQSVSPTHYNTSEWNDPVSSNCYGETEPVNGFNYSGAYPVQMRVLQGVVKSMRYPAYMLDITTLSEMRKDAHPSVYSGDLSPEQRANPPGHSDCSHWCLPGLPDTWNQLFYTALFFS